MANFVPNISDNNHFSPNNNNNFQLFEMIRLNHFVDFQIILKNQNNNLEMLDEYSNTPLLFACYMGRYLFVKLLCESGANFNRINIYGNKSNYFFIHQK